MKLHRFIGDFDIRKGGAILLPEDFTDQIRSVLRLRPNDIIILSDGHGLEGRARIASLGKNGAIVEILDVSLGDRGLGRKVILFASIIKKENFELVVQKAVECGVEKIVPIISDRTVKLGLNMERLGKIVREAAEQSGRTILPEVSNPVSFSDALDIAEGKIILFHLGGDPFIPASGEDGPVSVFIGPEGGFTEKEAFLARNRGAEITSLGNLVLRAETAAIVASYISRYV
ncbi:MAG: RsmE family RNA methyltransferase [Candidatus Colwellbacteria bacterium]|nr:RsmE family RNA methyltransferase [Candidatus Colwellbacteria bacterium]